MKIGIFDNLANNAYRLAKIFRKQGYQADLLVDGSDVFPMSQPLWEDCDFTVSTHLLGKKRLTQQFWERKSVELRWEKPTWIKETIRKGEIDILREMVLHPHRHLNSIRTLVKYGSLFPCSFGSITSTMKEYDVVIAFGLGPIYAFSAEVPFIHYPYGGDLIIIPFQKNCVALLQRTALENAKYVIIGDPDLLEYLKKLGIASKAVFIPLMIDTDVYKPLSKNQAMNALEPDLRDRVYDKFIFFVPSRQDFYWKGSDKLLKAFCQLVQERKDVFMVLSGWGNDLEKSKALVEQLNLQEHTFFLPYILSKQRLINFFSAAHVVIDQFNLGAYGTSTMEAMACGKPVIMDCDMKRYSPYFKELPPILNAKSEEEIYFQMLKLAGNKGDICERIGKKSREWMMEFHGATNNLDKIIKLCQDSVNGLG
jgi:glycosyltransferase involved in cell wall biosynthesis